VPLESRELIPILLALNEGLTRSLKTSTGCLTKDQLALEDLSRVSSKVVEDLLMRLDRIGPQRSGPKTDQIDKILSRRLGSRRT
jgi:hypothetical protein